MKNNDNNKKLSGNNNKKPSISNDTTTSNKPKKVSNRRQPKVVEEEYKKLKSEIMQMLPIAQSDIWKKLNIDRRKCSRLLEKIEKEGLIKRTKIKLKGGSSSFMVKAVEIDKPKERDFSALLSGSGKIAPCCCCQATCNPITCQMMYDWVMDTA